MTPVPVIIAGKFPDIAARVREGLLPEYDVVHVVFNAEQGVKDLPLLLSDPSEVPENTSDNLGSRNYGERPLAVILGGGFNNEMVQELRDASKDVKQGIAWIRADLTRIAGMPPYTDAGAYGAETAVRVKRKLQELGVGTVSPEKHESLYLYT